MAVASRFMSAESIMSREQRHTISPQSRMQEVLIVEDEPLAREATARYLHGRGYAVTSVKNGDEALRAATRNPPDILVCDWQLGAGMDGVAVARVLQDRFDVPVIFITAHPLETLRAAAGDLRIAGYFHKPVSLPDLADTVEEATP